jgi:hypothetical protein
MFSILKVPPLLDTLYTYVVIASDRWKLDDLAPIDHPRDSFCFLNATRLLV